MIRHSTGSVGTVDFAQEERSSSPGVRSPRIAVIDDNQEFVAVLAAIFDGQFGLVPATAESINAIAAVKPSLLIVDVHAKDDGHLGGWELVTLARRHRDLRRVPIVVCTADLILDADGDGRAGHPDVHLLTKPFALEVVENLVGRLLPQRGR